MDGFGAAMTDSSAWLITRSHDRRAARRPAPPALLASGINLSYLRIPTGASDFSLSHYTYDDTCCDLSDFSVAPDEAHRIPILLQAKA